MDLKELAREIEILEKNETKVDRRTLETKYAKPYKALRDQIIQGTSWLISEMMKSGIGPIKGITKEQQKRMSDKIVEIRLQEIGAGHVKEISNAIMIRYDLDDAYRLAYGYFTMRIQYEAYAPFWIQHCQKGADGRIRNDLIGMAWHDDASVWIADDGNSWTLMFPPDQDRIDAQYQQERRWFRNYLSERKT